MFSGVVQQQQKKLPVTSPAASATRYIMEKSDQNLAKKTAR
jgi:hypothetical protein